MCTDRDPGPRGKTEDCSNTAASLCYNLLHNTHWYHHWGKNERVFNSKLNNLIVNLLFFFFFSFPLDALITPKLLKQDFWWAGRRNNDEFTPQVTWSNCSTLPRQTRQDNWFGSPFVCWACTDEMISSNKWAGLNFLCIYLFCPHFFSFGLRCQSTLPRWIHEGFGKLESNMCIFCKLRHHGKGNSKSSVNSYQHTSVCFSVQLSKCAIPHVLK